VTELRLDQREDSVVLSVRAAPGARRERIVGVLGDALKIAVAAPPEKGRANRRIADLLTEVLGLPARSVQLLSGATSRDKRFAVTGLTVAELRARLDAHLSA
jgi:uncharacterized protein (TIGR00251 family)